MCSKSARATMDPFDFSERHSILIPARPETILNSVPHYRLGMIRFSAPTLYLRGLPARLLHAPLRHLWSFRTSRSFPRPIAVWSTG